MIVSLQLILNLSRVIVRCNNRCKRLTTRGCLESQFQPQGPQGMHKDHKIKTL